MQSRTRSMSMPGAGDGTPSRWSCALKSSEASSAISPLDAAHVTARVEDPIWIKGLLEGAHDRKTGWRWSPDVEGLLASDRRGGHHHLTLSAGSQAQPRKGLDSGRSWHRNVDHARRGLGNDPGIRRHGRQQPLAGGQWNDGAKHHAVVRRRGPIAGGVPEGRRDLRLFHPAAGLADESDGQVPGGVHLTRIADELEGQGPPAPTPTLPRE